MGRDVNPLYELPRQRRSRRGAWTSAMASTACSAVQGEADRIPHTALCLYTQYGGSFALLARGSIYLRVIPPITSPSATPLTTGSIISALQLKLTRTGAAAAARLGLPHGGEGACQDGRVWVWRTWKRQQVEREEELAEAGAQGKSGAERVSRQDVKQEVATLRESKGRHHHDHGVRGSSDRFQLRHEPT
ncbi:hypothetical protein CALVIDRAFT_525733 [Calocera viscosa TUFC12733]|uniref:Uncharacterized protein n=1 Tax=Calocera viscosa (strain TUFC12733) TaxID=1330018 RepID=A0A167PER9_CALVF|nr:hypothetical protein CALVIDRAFT_525733 [Calocera viscosa TUFC12733]